MMFEHDNVMQIMYEQCHTFADRHELDILTEAETTKLSNVVLSDLYQDIVDKAHVDYGDIPNSKGRIEKYKGTANMIKSLDIIDALCAKDGRNKEAANAVETVKAAIINLSANANKFEAGFKTDNDFIMVLYNSIALSCVEATSHILSSYINYAKRADEVEFQLIDAKDRSGNLHLNVLTNFNRGCKSGEIQKAMNQSILNNRSNLTGVATALALTAGATLIIPSIRNLIFGVYYTRMRVSDFLDQQAKFVEANKASVKNMTGISPQEKDKIAKKQKELAEKLEKIADKIKVDYKLAEKRGNADVAKANAQYSLKNVSSKAGSLDGDFSLF